MRESLPYDDLYPLGTLVIDATLLPETHAVNLNLGAGSSNVYITTDGEALVRSAAENDSALSNSKQVPMNLESVNYFIIKGAGKIYVHNAFDLVRLEILQQVDAGDQDINVIGNVKFNLKNLIGFQNLKGFKTQRTFLTGKLSFLERCSSMESLILYLSNGTALLDDEFNGYNLSNLLASMPNLSSITLPQRFAGTLTTLGNIASFNCQFFNGEIKDTVFSSSPLLNYFSIAYSSYSDINGKTINWSSPNLRPSSYIIPAFGITNLGNTIDNALINLSNCTPKTIISTTPIYEKTIAFLGTRTTASDSAVATLKSMGYIVNINNITL